MPSRRSVRRWGASFGAVALIVALALFVVFGGRTERSDRADAVPIAASLETRSNPTPRLASAESIPPFTEGLVPISGGRRARVGSKASDAPAVAGELIVKYRSGLSKADRERTRNALGVTLIGELPFAGADLVGLPPKNEDEVRAAASRNPSVASLEPNFIYRAMARTPNDPGFRNLWGLDNQAQSVLGSTGSADADIDATEAWDLTTGSRTVAVGVVDTGVDYRHTDLAPNIWANPGETGGGKESNGVDDDHNGYVDDWRGWDWIDDDNDPADLHGHGTHVAGTIGARGSNGIGVTGVSWQVGIVPLRVLGADGSGTTAEIAAAFAYAGSNRIPVVNASLGGPGSSQTLRDTIARYPDTLYVVAAGNEAADNESVPSYPCNYQAANLICVASTKSDDRLSSFSNYGATSVDIAAPGSSILSTYPTFVEDFGDGFDGDVASRWSAGGNGTAWGSEQEAGDNFIADSPSANYVGPSDTHVATSALTSLTGIDCRVRYDLRLDVASSDRFRVEASSPGSSWQTISSWSGSTSGTWVSMSDDLSAFDGGDVSVRFRLIAASGGSGRGVDIDNVRMRCLDDGAAPSFAYLSGTSMATPHVAGAAALIWAGTSTPSVPLVRAALLEGGDTNQALVGKVATGARLNVDRGLRATSAGALPQRDDVIGTPTQAAPTIGPAPPDASPVPTPTPAPSGTTNPTPTPSGDASPTPAPAAEHPRTVTLRLKGELVAKGRVTSDDGFEACSEGVPVTIYRNGERIAETTTNEFGVYRLRLENRSGRYLASADPVTVGDGSDRCSTTTSHRGDGARYRRARS